MEHIFILNKTYIVAYMYICSCNIIVLRVVRSRTLVYSAVQFSTDEAKRISNKYNHIYVFFPYIFKLT